MGENCVVCWGRFAGSGGFCGGGGAGEWGSGIDSYCSTLDSIQYEPDDDAGADVAEWDDDYAC